MKKISLLFIIIGISFQIAQSQTYYPFPTDSAKWNNLFWGQWSPTDMELINSIYFLQGDTILNNLSYNKVYYLGTDYSNNSQYLGGLREDSVKNIFFFPYTEVMLDWPLLAFQNDTSESLLYTFNDLEIGMILPINSGYAEITVVGIDSILIGVNYRKRYEVENNQMLFYPEYWIEGIGSTKNLFSPFTAEFEWELFTLCYEDTASYYINTPNGEDSCHYSLATGITELTKAELELKAYPNPAKEKVNISVSENVKVTKVRVYNIAGMVVLNQSPQPPPPRGSQITLDVSELVSG
ncbi:MAG: hypothetical protein DRI54_04795, partial [Bacteroidetes bacterium]